MTASGGGEKSVREKGTVKQRNVGEGVQYCEAVLEGLRYIKGGVAPCRESGLFIYSKNALSL